MAITIIEHQHLPYRRMFIINLNGDLITVTVTASAYVVQDWITSTLHLNRDFLGRLIVGIGVQWGPGPVHTTSATTLQLCVRKRCLIYQLNHRDHEPINLRQFLIHPCNIFVGFRSYLYKKKLLNAGLEMKRHPMDLKMYARIDDNNENLKTVTFQQIVQRFLGIYDVCTTAETTMSDWSQMLLTHNQVLQAALVAYCSFQIGQNLRLWEIPGLIPTVSQSQS